MNNVIPLKPVVIWTGVERRAANGNLLIRVHAQAQWRRFDDVKPTNGNYNGKPAVV